MKHDVSCGFRIFASAVAFVVFLQMFFIGLRKFPSIPTFLSVLFMKGCWILLSGFSYCLFYRDNHVAFVFNILITVYYINCFGIKNQSCICGINFTWL